MKAIAVLLLLLCNTVVYAQECDCRKKLDGVQVYLRKNYVGFIDKVTPLTQQAYTAMLTKLRLQAAATKNASHCLLLINRYLRFFKDQHLSLRGHFTPVTETIALNPAQLEQLEKQPLSSIAGIYQLDDQRKLALVKHPKGIRSYAAVIQQWPDQDWKPGDVLFELAATGPDKFDVINYTGHRLSFDTIMGNSLVALGWRKTGAAHGPAAAEAPAWAGVPVAPYFFRQLDDSTGYLRIGSFAAADYPLADSVLNTCDEYLRRNPRLVLDVRDNGAGSDKLTERLRPLLYTQPVRIIGADFLATPDNISAWGHILDEQAGKLPDEYLEQVRNLIHQGESSQGRLVSMGPDENMILPSPMAAPVKVAVIMNRKCSNTAEQFLLEAMQSQKVKLMGTATAGALDYLNVNTARFYGPDFMIDYPVTRSRRVPAGQGIDNKGIQPVVKLDFQSPGWLDEVLKKL
ncbi:S41 family peptidase [Chitinophaga sp. 212800010-3]|uniref:S41 family peptidase n=1 Tax=unclassified Chitinophaga TaxID=2619133 RepID=UPI002DF668A2|nr:TSPc domain-containing protein [Chitinophaga sp. 212800010-3]